MTARAWLVWQRHGDRQGSERNTCLAARGRQEPSERSEQNLQRDKDEHHHTRETGLALWSRVGACARLLPPRKLSFQQLYRIHSIYPLDRRYAPLHLSAPRASSLPPGHATYYRYGPRSHLIRKSVISLLTKVRFRRRESLRARR